MYTIYHNPRCKKSRAGLQYMIDQVQLGCMGFLQALVEPVNFVEEIVDDPHLFHGCKLVVQFKPDIFPDLFHGFLKGAELQFGILVPGHQEGPV